MMTVKKRIVSIVLAVVMFASAAVFAVFGWLSSPKNTLDFDIGGSFVEEYFHSGSGSEDDPFVITRPQHYFHLVEFFQRQTSLPVRFDNNQYNVEFGSDYLYFQIGSKDMDKDGTDEESEFKVFAYNDDGSIVYDANGQPVYSDTLNLNYYSGDNALMPIGTSEVPFFGSFDGNGLTVENLNIRATEEINIDGETFTRRTSDVGIFGYVANSVDGNDTLIANTFFDGVTINLTDAQNGEVNLDHIDEHETIYVGYLVGHLHEYTNCDVENAVNAAPIYHVYVNDCTILGGEHAINNYGYFGEVDLLDGETVETLENILDGLGAIGTGDEGWGGSIDMKQMYTRLQNVLDVAPVAKKLATRTIVIDEVNGTTDTTETTQDMPSPGLWNNTDRVRYYDGGANGAYSLYDRNGTYQYTYLYGVNHDYDDDLVVTTYTYKDKYDDGYIVSDGGGHYLGATATAVTAPTAENSASKWVLDESGHLFCYVGRDKYYLSGTNALSVSDTASTVWTKNADGSLSYSYGGRTYYLVYNNGWTVFPSKTSKLIHANDGGTLRYLNLNGTTAVQSGTAAGSATHWIYNGTSGQIYTFANGNLRFLNASGDTLSVGTTGSTTWNYSGGNLSYTSGGKTYYLMCEDGSWRLYDPSIPTYRIGDGNGHYLKASTNAISSSNEADASEWTRDANGRLYTLINGTTYYLTNTTGTLAVSTAAGVVWNPAAAFGNGTQNQTLTSTVGGKTYFLRYGENGAWELIDEDATIVVITDGNGHYLANNGTNITNSANESTATKFTYDSAAGTLMTVINGTKYYLYTNVTRSGNWGNYTYTPSLSFSTNTLRWTYASNRLSATSPSYSRTEYLTYNGTSWTVLDNTVPTIPAGSGYNLSYTNGNYTYYLNLNAAHTGIATETNTRTAWEFSNGTSGGYIYTTVGNKNYYLRNNNGTLTVTDDQSLATNWTRGTSGTTNGRIYDGRYRIQYYNNNFTLRNNTGSANPTMAAATEDVKLYLREIETEPAVLTVAKQAAKATNVVAMTDVTEKTSLTCKDTEVQVIEKKVETETVSYEGPNIIPILAEQTSPFAVSNKNTGYITSSITSEKAGNMRVSYYNMSYIYASLSTNTAQPNSLTYNNGRLEIITRTADTGGWVRISDEYNRSNTTVNRNLSGYTKTSYEDLGLARYADSRAEMTTLLNNQTNIYGLHFMNAKISMEDTVVAPEVTILRNTYTNYEMPNNAFDFRLQDDGLITFYAGSYYSTNVDSFFSLHQIFRDADNNLTAIKEIKYIYSKQVMRKGKEVTAYYYQYTDGTYSDVCYKGKPVDGQTPSGGTLEFDTTWITKPNGIVQNAMYYFEIPAFAGEYALGSVDGSAAGAYLLYLDIAANGKQGANYNVENKISNKPLFTQVEYRDAPDSLDEPYHASMNYSYEVPEGATDENFSVNVTFDGVETYHFIIKNETGEDMTLTIVLCDNNTDPDDEFPYVYTIQYNSGAESDVYSFSSSFTASSTATEMIAVL